MPISNSAIERVFSALAFIKSKIRNKLLDKTLDNLLFVYNLHIS